MQEALEIDVLIVGAGVMGLSVGARLARAGREVVIVDAEPGFGRHASSRNSEVLHAGFYYEPGSAKARHCRRGRELLLDRAHRLGLPHLICGKLVIANKLEDLPKLEGLLRRGHENGVDGLEIIDRSALLALEPEVQGIAALRSGETGIIDSHALMASLAREIEDRGGSFAWSTPIRALQVDETGALVEVGGSEPLGMRPRFLVNAAGFGAHRLSAAFRTADAALPSLRLVRGHYLAYAGPSPFSQLIYPLPEAEGLGIHATHDLDGRLRFGPDTMEVSDMDYGLPEDLAPIFARSIRRYWPGVDETRLLPGYAGIRTKAITADGRAPDFQILGPEAHGVAGVVHLLGIESPGLTAALSIAEEVADKLGL